MGFFDERIPVAPRDGKMKSFNAFLDEVASAIASALILSSTGDFATVHGEGTVEGIDGVAETLSGNIHFRP